MFVAARLKEVASRADEHLVQTAEQTDLHVLEDIVALLPAAQAGVVSHQAADHR